MLNPTELKDSPSLLLSMSKRHRATRCRADATQIHGHPTFFCVDQLLSTPQYGRMFEGFSLLIGIMPFGNKDVDIVKFHAVRTRLAAGLTPLGVVG